MVCALSAAHTDYANLNSACTHTHWSYISDVCRQWLTFCFGYSWWYCRGSWASCNPTCKDFCSVRIQVDICIKGWSTYLTQAALSVRKSMYRNLRSGFRPHSQPLVWLECFHTSKTINQDRQQIWNSVAFSQHFMALKCVQCAHADDACMPMLNSTWVHGDNSQKPMVYVCKVVGVD